MLRFFNTIEKTDESSIVEVQDRVTGDIIDQKEKRRFIRKEIKEFEKYGIEEENKEQRLFDHSFHALE
jgi:hypothetical protein